jgi:hypothetical protein
VSNPAQRKLAGELDAFVTKFSPDGQSLAYSTYLGGATNEWAGGLAVNAKGEAYLAGTTYSADFPTMNSLAPAGDRTGHYRAFAAKLSEDGGRLLYSTLFPGSDNDSAASGIDLDTAGNAWVAGHTRSAEFPTTKNAYQTTLKGGLDLFLVQLADDTAAPASSLSASPGLLPFTAPVNGAAPMAQAISVTAAAAGSAQTFAVSTTGSWLSATPASARVPATVSVSVNAAGLAVGSYQGAVVLTPAGGQPLTVPVILTVGPQAAVISGISPSTIAYNTTTETTVTISGSGFEPGAMVMFGILGGKVQAMDVTRVDANTIRTSIPAWMPGFGNQIGVTVTNPGGGDSNTFNITVVK